MSKRGRGRRTPEQRIEAKDNRSTIAYLRRIQRALSEESKGWAPETTEDDAPVSETTSDASSK